MFYERLSDKIAELQSRANEEKPTSRVHTLRVGE